MTIPALPVTLGAKASHVGDFIRAAFHGVNDPDAVVVVSVPAPLVPVDALLELAPNEDAVVWDPPEGPSFSAIGAADVVLGSGATRIAQIRDRARAVATRIRVVADLDPAPPPPRFFGGFAFQQGGASTEPWTSFGDARFVLPRFRYARAAERAWLTLAARGDELASDAARRGLIERTEAIWTALRGPGHGARRKSAPVLLGRNETSEAQWRDLVATIVARIGHREFEKIVIARRSTLSFEAPIDVLDVLEELSSSAKHGTRFAFRFGRGTFLGATPERLVRLRGLALETESLAGTSRPGDARRAAEMMESPKEREEHAIVVREIVSALSSLCATLEHPVAPEIRVLPHLLHLTTPIRGVLQNPVHVLDLVDRLHPTPAVGGVPTREAVRFIASHEPVERGWYASPVGWFDANGDGEFAVALRSGAFVGANAFLYAGGGIVRDSDPASEYAETRLKMATLCAALHVDQ
jgi:isochorismate synthase